MDNSTIMLLRLLDLVGVKDIAIAGFDGYDAENAAGNYISDELEIQSVKEDAISRNKEISEMLVDFYNTRLTKLMKIQFITKSRFEECVN